MTEQRTSGPWRWEYKDTTTLLLRGKNGVIVAEFHGVSMADAGAIEALPDVLDALRDLVSEPTSKRALKAAQKALDKSNDPFEPVEEKQAA